MVKRSEHTKKLIRWLWAFRILDWICLMLPVIIYCFYALFSGDSLISGRITIAFSFVIVIIMVILNAVAKLKLRCPVWFLLIGLYIAVRDKLLPLIIILAITSALDDFVLSPLKKKYEEKVRASETIDERMGDNVREEI